MSDKEQQRGDMVCCEACGTAAPGYDVVHYGSMEQGYRDLCTRCFNAEVASALGLEGFENVRLQPVVMTDCAGERHEFHFQVRLLGHMTALDAFELIAGAPGGYQFETVSNLGVMPRACRDDRRALQRRRDRVRGCRSSPRIEL